MYISFKHIRGYIASHTYYIVYHHLCKQHCAYEMDFCKLKIIFALISNPYSYM